MKGEYNFRMMDTYYIIEQRKRNPHNLYDADFLFVTWTNYFGRGIHQKHYSKEKQEKTSKNKSPKELEKEIESTEESH